MSLGARVEGARALLGGELFGRRKDRNVREQRVDLIRGAPVAGGHRRRAPTEERREPCAAAVRDAACQASAAAARTTHVGSLWVVRSA